ncbi:MAG: hypothetical protein Ct9H90mP25_1030 [Gammaproteobacteria bacterium]|nr:MAG: hypothetical protein Ct9H90mP25_1030 [Gammaproteobacteria bacterium]
MELNSILGWSPVISNVSGSNDDWFESEMLTSVSIMVRSRPTISISLNVDLEQFNS